MTSVTSAQKGCMCRYSEHIMVTVQAGATILANMTTTDIMDATYKSVDGSDDSGTDSGIDFHTVAKNIIGILGVVDNGFVMVVILCYKPMRMRLTNVYIINQSVVDLVASLSFLITLNIKIKLDQFKSDLAKELTCMLYDTQVFMWSMYMVSTYNLIAISVDRFLEVVFPIWHKVNLTRNVVYGIICSVWAFGILFNIAFTIPTTKIIDGVCWAAIVYPNQTAAKATGTIIFIIQFLVPVLIMIFCYTKIVLSLRSRVSPAGPSNVSATEKDRVQKMAKIQQNVIKTMAVVCVAFILCWVWNQMFFLLLNLGYHMMFNTPFYPFTVYAANINSIINPFIYIFQYKQFQTAIQVVVLRRKTTEKLNSNNTTATI